MNRTLYYYNAFITHNGKITNIHLSELLDPMIAAESESRLRSTRYGNICLLNMQYPDTNLNDESDRKIVIGKFRENKPFLGNLGTDRIDEINDDVLELTSVFYRRQSRLLIVEYNHHGVRPNGLEDYLSRFLPSDKENSWMVSLEQIEPKIGFADIEQSRKIKKVEFKIDLTARNRQLLHNNNNNNNNESVLGDILSKSIETHDQFGANVAYIGFGNGRKRKEIIDPEALVSLLRGLDLEGEVFESVKVTYKSPTTKRTETLDIKNAGVLKEVIEIDGDGWELITDEIEEHFYNNGRTGENAHRSYVVEEWEKLPNLRFENIELIK